MGNQNETKNTGSINAQKVKKGILEEKKPAAITRRDFIKTAAITGAVTAVAPSYLD